MKRLSLSFCLKPGPKFLAVRVVAKLFTEICVNPFARFCDELYRSDEWFAILTASFVLNLSSVSSWRL